METFGFGFQVWRPGVIVASYHFPFPGRLLRFFGTVSAMVGRGTADMADREFLAWLVIPTLPDRSAQCRVTIDQADPGVSRPDPQFVAACGWSVWQANLKGTGRCEHLLPVSVDYGPSGLDVSDGRVMLCTNNRAYVDAKETNDPRLFYNVEIQLNFQYARITPSPASPR